MNDQPDITGLLPEGKTITSRIMPFDFEGHEVRVIDRNGVPGWVLANVCRVFGISNVSDAASSLDDDERGIGKIETPSGWQDMVIINESGLYNPILKSRKLAAKRLTKWVTSDVLSIGNRIATLGLPAQLVFGN